MRIATASEIAEDDPFAEETAPDVGEAAVTLTEGGELFVKYANADDEVKRLQTALSAAKEARTALEPKVEEALLHLGTSSVKLSDGSGRSVSGEVKLFPKHLVNSESTVTVFEQLEQWKWLVKKSIHHMTLLGLVREFAEGDGIPPELAGVLGVSEQFKLSVTRSASRSRR